MCWPNSRAAQERDELRRQEDADEQRRRARDQDLAHQTAVPRSSASATTSRPTPARGLDQDGVAGLEQVRQQRRGGAASSTWRCDPPSNAAPIVRGERADGDEQVDARRRGVAADLLVVGGLVGPELEHVAEHGDASPGCGRGEVVEGGAHRHRVGVVAVVDDDDVARKGDPLTAQARQRDRRRRPSGSTPTARAAASAASALRRMCAEVERDASGPPGARRRRRPGRTSRSRTSARRCGSSSGSPRGHDRRPARRERRDQLGLRRRRSPRSSRAARGGPARR